MPDERPVRLGDRRRRRPLPLHALGGLPGGRRPQEHALPGRARVVRRGKRPRVTYTEPEIAVVGPDRDGRPGARRCRFSGRHLGIRPQRPRDLRRRFRGDVREGPVGDRGRILGATIVHPRAGDLLAEIVLAKKNGLPLSALGSVIHAYPSLSEIHGAVAREVLKTALTPGRKALLTKLAAFLRR